MGVLMHVIPASVLEEQIEVAKSLRKFNKECPNRVQLCQDWPVVLVNLNELKDWDDLRSFPTASNKYELDSMMTPLQ